MALAVIGGSRAGEFKDRSKQKTSLKRGRVKNKPSESMAAKGGKKNG